MSFRKALWYVFILAVLCACGTFFAQYVLGKNPCVLCISQRIAVILTALVAFVCALFPNRSLFWRMINALMVSIVSIVGLGVALYQIYIQHLPVEEQPSCGAPWTFRFRDAPLFDWYEPIIRGTGNCGEVQTFMYVSLPIWSALFFSTVLIWIWTWLIRGNRHIYR